MRQNKVLFMITKLLTFCVSTFSSIQIFCENEQESKKSIKDFTENYNNASLRLIAAGKLNDLPSSVVFGVWVTSKSEETIESGRSMAFAFVNAYFKQLLNSQYVHAQYAKIQSKAPEQFPDKLSLKNVGVRIAYWDEQVERPKAPYLSEIDFYDNTFRYYEADPKTQGLRLIREESYEKAVELLQTSPKPLE